MEENDSPIREYVEAASRAYGSLENPNFLFVSELIERDPYRELIDRVSQNFKVKDRTAIDDDVCFYLELSSQGKWHLLLSLIGPYAMLLRVTDQWPARFRSPIVQVVNEPATGPEEVILSLLRADGFQVLSAEEAETAVRFAVPPETEPEDGPLFRLLFSDATTVPWKRV